MSVTITGSTAIPQSLDAEPLWGPLIVAICLAAMLVAVSCLIIRLVTAPNQERGTSDVALDLLREQRKRGEISDRQFQLARAMLHAAKASHTPAKALHGSRR